MQPPSTSPQEPLTTPHDGRQKGFFGFKRTRRPHTTLDVIDISPPMMHVSGVLEYNDLS